jgi:hypothetical protein
MFICIFGNKLLSAVILGNRAFGDSFRFLRDLFIGLFFKDSLFILECGMLS